jgi:uncharacterized membrane protein YcaP (DUF421 family)
MEVERIAIRAAFTFVVLLALLRLSGRRAIAQGSALDFVGSASGILAHIVTGLIGIASPRFHDWIEGKPAVLLRDGEPNPDALRAERVSLNEVAEHLRHVACLMTSGRL